MTRVHNENSKGRSRPSAWPVYVMCAVVGVFSFSFATWIWFAPQMAQIPPSVYENLSPGAQEFAGFMQRVAPYAFLFGVYGIFGIVAAVGAGLFRPWGWWFVVVWTVVLVAWCVLLHLSFRIRPTSPWAILWNVAFIALIVWLLVTRRRLYFPHT